MTMHAPLTAIRLVQVEKDSTTPTNLAILLFLEETLLYLLQ